MTGSVTHLWRHPIKSHGRESINIVALEAGKTMPWDRHWAVSHDNTKYAGSGWGSCQNFMIGTRTPGLAGLWAELDENTARVSLRHEALGAFEFAPDNAEDVQQFLAWLAPLLPQGRAQPKEIVNARDRGMTDTDYPSISIMNQSSHRAVAQKLGQPLEIERWRGNIWLDGLAPWEEFDWIGKHVQIGATVVEIREPIKRCMHTTANPKTGQRDADTLGALNSGWGHQDFGVYGVVVQGGTVTIGDLARIST
jgi:uncharacterized protein YcbX